MQRLPFGRSGKVAARVGGGGLDEHAGIVFGVEQNQDVLLAAKGLDQTRAFQPGGLDDDHRRLEVVQCLADRTDASRLVDEAVAGRLDHQGGERGNRQLTISDDGKAMAVRAHVAGDKYGGARPAHQRLPFLLLSETGASATMRVPSIVELRTPKVPLIRSSRSRLPSNPRPRPSRVRLTSLREKPTPLS